MPQNAIKEQRVLSYASHRLHLLGNPGCEEGQLCSSELLWLSVKCSQSQDIPTPQTWSGVTPHRKRYRAPEAGSENTFSIMLNKAPWGPIFGVFSALGTGTEKEEIRLVFG